MPKYGSKDRIRQLEEAAGIESANATVSTPYAVFSAPEYTGPRPWRSTYAPPGLPSTLQPGSLYPLSSIPKKKLRDRSTEGSPPFSKSELKQGYRKVGKGK